MVVDTKLYDLLGVSPDADERTLKKAFMMKARELHPDKNKDDPHATEKFQAVNEAYEVLKDPEKRAAYDKYGPDALKEGMNPNAADAFRNIFDFFDFGPRSNAGRRERQRTPDVRFEIHCTLEDLYNGVSKKLKIKHQILCPECQGSGCKDGKKPKTCPECDGKGQKVQVRRMGPMITQQVLPCDKCKGTGEIIDPADVCKKCKGAKVTEEDKIFEVHVERGMEDGDTIVFRGEADEAPNADTGDFIVIVRQKKHATFVRHHDDLLIKKKITLSEALLGTKIVITHLDGRKLIIDSPKDQVITPGAIRVIEREGMPIRSNVYDRGRLFISFDVQFPQSTQITPALKTALEKAIPIPDETKGVKEDDENVFKAVLRNGTIEEFENAKKHYQESRREAYNSGDDDGERSASCQPM